MPGEVAGRERGDVDGQAPDDAATGHLVQPGQVAQPGPLAQPGQVTQSGQSGPLAQSGQVAQPGPLVQSGQVAQPGQPGPLAQALDLLAAQFPLYDWTYREVPGTSGTEVGFEWFGGDDEEVMVCVFRGSSIGERFHRQGFFFLNYAYQGDYQALSHRSDNLVTVREGQMYAGQPFSGYALRSSVGEQCTIVGVLVRTQTFYREFLPPVMADAELLEFYLGPRDDAFSEEFRHVTIPASSPVRQLLEIMVVEYASQRGDSQKVLKPMALALVELVAREWRAEHLGGGDPGGAGRLAGAGTPERTVSSAVIEAAARDLGRVSLRELAGRLGYHPNYLSTLVRRETGKSFSQLVLQLRMERASLLVERTTLSVEEVARTVGYSSTSNFYRAYMGYFGHSPRGTRGTGQG